MNTDISMDRLVIKRDFEALTTKDLITWLQNEDPTGSLPVVIDGVPLWAVSVYPFWHDGTPMLRTSPQEYTSMTEGYKLHITGYGWDDAISDDINTTFKDVKKRYGGCYESRGGAVLSAMQQERSESLSDLVANSDSDDKILGRLSIKNKALVATYRENHPEESIFSAVMTVLNDQDS